MIKQDCVASTMLILPLEEVRQAVRLSLYFGNFMFFDSVIQRVDL